MFHVNVKNETRQFPNWHQRGRIRKVDEAGDIVQGQYAFGGEAVRVSPRYQKNGANYRVRPERPVAFFAAYCFENGLLPTQLTPEECEANWVLDLLEPIWDANKHQFPKLESPYAACDQATEPSLRTGFSFNVPQVLVEQLGTVRSTQANPSFRPHANGSSNSQQLEAARRKIEEMRARAATANGTQPAQTKKKSAVQ